MTSRRWVFTLNNPTQDDLTFPDYVRYAVWQRERGEETGTAHLQGYIELIGNQRLSALKKWLPTAHWEVARGNRDQCRAYCRKEETRVSGPYEHGDFGAGGQGSRTDLDEVKRLLDLGTSESVIADEHFGVWVRHHKAFREYKRIRSSPRSYKTVVEVLWGDPGTGKSRAVAESHQGDTGCYWKPRSNWWDGYEGQDTVVLDDYYGWLPFDLLLRVCDRYPLQVEIKGGAVEFVAKKVFITSNKPPSEWYQSDKLDLRALYRRLDKVTHYVKRQSGEVEIEDQTALYKV